MSSKFYIAISAMLCYL